MSEIKSDKNEFLLYLMDYLCKGIFLFCLQKNQQAIKFAKLAKKNQIPFHVS